MFHAPLDQQYPIWSQLSHILSLIMTFNMILWHMVWQLRTHFRKKTHGWIYGTTSSGKVKEGTLKEEMSDGIESLWYVKAWFIDVMRKRRRDFTIQINVILSAKDALLGKPFFAAIWATIYIPATVRRATSDIWVKICISVSAILDI